MYGRHLRSNYERAVLATNPVSFWLLDELAGTVAHDVMGVNPGTYVAAPTLGAAGLLTGDPGTAVTFASASSQRVETSSDPPLLSGGKCSLGAWIKTTTADQTAMGKYSGAGAYAQLSLSGGGPSFTLTGAQAASAGPAANDGAPHLLIGTWDGTTIRCYLDGVVGIYTAAYTSLAEPGGHVALGFFPAVGGFFNGDMARPAIWSRALSPDEPAWLYRVGVGR